MDTSTAPLASIGIDIGKEVFHLVGFGNDGKIAFRRKIKRQRGHEPRMIPATHARVIGYGTPAAPVIIIRRPGAVAGAADNTAVT